MQTVVNTLEMLRRAGQKLGPYLMVEILLPGGTLLALLLFLYQRGKVNTRSNEPWTAGAITRALVHAIGRFCARCGYNGDAWRGAVPIPFR